MKVWIAWVPIILLAQSAFDVASVKPIQMTDTSWESIVAHPGSLAMHSVRLRTCIKWAYGVKDVQIAGPAFLGSPGWQGKNFGRYEIVAKAEGAPVAKLKPMMQVLLAERFKLSVHREMREVSGYTLVVARKSSELHPASDDDPEQGGVGGGGTVINGINVTMPEFADGLSGPMMAPIWDTTHLEGRFNFHINYASYLSQDGHVPTDADRSEALATAMKTVIGLKLERGKRSLEMLVIDHLEQVPTGN